MSQIDFDSTTNITLLYCQQCVMVSADISTACGKVNNPVIKTRSLPCSSKVEVSHMLKILANGMDGVLLLACDEKNCRFHNGSTLAEKRIEYAWKLLTQANLNPKRAGFARGQNLSEEEIISLLVNYSSSLQFRRIP